MSLLFVSYISMFFQLYYKWAPVCQPISFWLAKSVVLLQAASPGEGCRRW